MPTIKIDDKDYDLDSLSQEAKAQLASIQFVEQELARLQMQAAALQTARNAYLQGLKAALPARQLFRLIRGLDATFRRRRSLRLPAILSTSPVIIRSVPLHHGFKLLRRGPDTREHTPVLLYRRDGQISITHSLGVV